MRYEDIDRAMMAPCPFCGQQGKYYIKNHWTLKVDEYRYSVECAECGAIYYGAASLNRQEAIVSAVSGWNHRT